MIDPRQPLHPANPPMTPRPAGAPLQPTAHPQQHPTPGMSPGMAPAAPRPVLRPAGMPQAPAHHPAPQHHPAPAGPAKIAAMPSMPVPQHEDDAIALIEEDEGGLDAATLHKKIKAFGNEAARVTKWKREPLPFGKGGPVRVRTF